MMQACDGPGSHQELLLEMPHLDEVSQALLVLQLDGPPLLLEGFVISMLPEAGQLVRLGNPLVAAQGLGDELAEARVAVGQPATWGYAVGLVLELLRGELIEVLRMTTAKVNRAVSTPIATLRTAHIPIVLRLSLRSRCLFPAALWL